MSGRVQDLERVTEYNPDILSLKPFSNHRRGKKEKTQSINTKTIEQVISNPQLTTEITNDCRNLIAC